MKINEVIVVEGKNDSLRLKQYFDVETIETSGMALKQEILEYIKEVNNKRGVILFLDPDIPGEKIRRKINDYIPNLKNAFVLKKDARTNKKVGIEHASYEILKEALDNLITYSDKNNSLSKEDYYDLGFSGNSDSKKKRALISKHFHLGEVNSKTFYKRLNMLNVTKEEIEKLL